MSTKPFVFLNSEQIDLNKIYVNPENIDSVFLTHKSNNGEINIVTKQKLFAVLTINEIINKFTRFKSISDSIIISIDNDLISDVSGIKIDGTYTINIKTEPLNNVKYLPKEFKNLTLINILLGKPQIHLKGLIDKIEKK